MGRRNWEDSTCWRRENSSSRFASPTFWEEQPQKPIPWECCGVVAWLSCLLSLLPLLPSMRVWMRKLPLRSIGKVFSWMISPTTADYVITFLDIYRAIYRWSELAAFDGAWSLLDFLPLYFLLSRKPWWLIGWPSYAYTHPHLDPIRFLLSATPPKSSFFLHFLCQPILRASPHSHHRDWPLLSCHYMFYWVTIEHYHHQTKFSVLFSIVMTLSSCAFWNKACRYDPQNTCRWFQSRRLWSISIADNND